jgi:tetratricopeptide (TPR) repeat protein
MSSRWTRAWDEFRLEGNIEVLKKAIAEEANNGEASVALLDFERFQTAMFERDYASAAHYLAQIAPETFALEEFSVIAPHSKALEEALLAVASGSAPSLQEHSLQAAEQEIFSKPAADFNERSNSLADLAVIHALLGRKEEAIREGENAIEVMEGPPGSIEKNARWSALALVYARTGEAEKALDLIEHLLTVPCDLHSGYVYNMTLTDLKWRWLWDPLRSHPRFRKLLAGPEPKTIY